MPSRLQKRILKYAQNNQLSLAAISVILLSFSVGTMTLLMSLNSTIENQSFDLRSKASMGSLNEEQLVPVNYDTGSVKLSADGLAILSSSTLTTGTPSPSRLTSDPGNLNYTTLEVEWNNTTLLIYFKSDGAHWWSNEIRTKTAGDSDWAYYKSDQPYFYTPLEQPYTVNEFNITSDDGNHQLYLKNLSLQAFYPFDGHYQGYFLYPPDGSQIQIELNNSITGYGINAYLYRDGELVTDQSQYRYDWTIQDEEVVTFTTEERCLEDISAPCPPMHASLSLKNPGTTTLMLKIFDSTDTLIEQTSWDITLKEPAACVPAGCSGQLCVSADQADSLVTTCEYRDEYACYQNFGTCELQSSGDCGWTESSELATCLEESNNGIPTPPPADDLRFKETDTSIRFFDSNDNPIEPETIAVGDSYKYIIQYCLQNNLKTQNPDPNPYIKTAEYINNRGHTDHDLLYSLITAHRDGACGQINGHVSKDQPTTTFTLRANINNAISETNTDNNQWSYSFTYQPQNTARCTATSSATLITDTAPSTQRLEGGGTGDGIMGTRWDFDRDGTWDDETVARTWIDHTFTKAGDFWPQYQIIDRNGWSDTCNARTRYTIQADATSEFPSYDLNQDGIVNALDYELYRQSFMRELLGDN